MIIIIPAGTFIGVPREEGGACGKVERYCPGYHIARTCDRNCPACTHVIVKHLSEAELPDWDIDLAYAPLKDRSNAPQSCEALVEGK